MFLNKLCSGWVALVTLFSGGTGICSADIPALPGIGEFLQKQGAEWTCIPGMITTYRQNDRYYWEIPDSIQGRDFFMTTTILKGAARQRRSEEQKYGYANDMLGPLVLRWQPGEGQLMLTEPLAEALQHAAPGEIAGLLKQKGEARLLFRFPLCARNESGALIDVTELLHSYFFSLWPFMFELGIGERRDAESGIREIRGGNDFILIRRFESYSSAPRGGRLDSDEESVRWEVGYCLKLLPETPMTVRYAHPQVGYFTQNTKEADRHTGSMEEVRLVKRWRVEPREEDREKYLRGELVEPAKPIVFYIDREIPASWIPYFIAGVNEWQKAFEKAGFKHAIYGRPAPLPDEDSVFTPDNPSYSYISYRASAIRNAYGHAMADARTGEIVCSRVVLYHGVLSLARQWYFAQVAMADERGRKLMFPDSLVGELLKLTVRHEVGHALGLTHNFIASSAGSVDQLRDSAYLKRNGYTASVMDYTRFNYVVQPEDGVPPEYLTGRIGTYDEFAIEWGYRWFPEQDPEQEKQVLDRWVAERQREKSCRFADDDASDPRAQAEDIGEDACKAALAGMKNLRRLMEQKELWRAGDHLSEVMLRDRYMGMLRQFEHYAAHVLRYVAGRYRYPESCAATGILYVPADREEQRQALAFVEEYVLNPPGWLYDNGVAGRFGADAEALAGKCWESALNALVQKVKTIYDFRQAGEEGYTAEEYLADLHRMLFGRFSEGKPVSWLCTAQQRYYIRGLKQLFDGRRVEGGLQLLLWQELKRIEREAQEYAGVISDVPSREWTQELLEILDNI